MKYWLMKSEPGELSIDDLSNLPMQTVEWFGVRNYQARNFMRDEMQVGDLALFWHSSCANPGIYGIVRIVTPAHPDSTQYNIESEYYDGKSSSQNPRWFCVDVKFLCKTKYLSIKELRSYEKLMNMQVLQRGNRLSITPVTKEEWDFLNKLLGI